ncbi:MAG: 6-carboxytetrahydropterin synthase QueD [Lachnospiraceae bacterium]|nr:6-carboxytetrahydropterin synthase QueD [Lachnospiraceae bacterium]MBQ9232615.1 6-carboxytetrahydropterin synthase QueD [Lachnospiraceae bacterium]
MYTLKTRSGFDSAHFLKGYDGKCSNIHGHHWSVEIVVGSDSLSEDEQIRGMVVDFSELKKDLREITDGLDHSLIIERGSLKDKTMEALTEENFKIVELDMRPTAENFAKYFYDLMSDKGYKVIESVVYETKNNCAGYRQD